MYDVESWIKITRDIKKIYLIYLHEVMHGEGDAICFIAKTLLMQTQRIELEFFVVIFNTFVNWV